MKKIIMSIIAITLCLALCACEDANRISDSANEAAVIQMKINIGEAVLCLSNSNDAVIDSLYAITSEDAEQGIDYFKKALELVRGAKTRVDASFAFPNFISKELGNLEENYEETLGLLSRYSSLSEKEKNELMSLLSDGTSKHILLLKATDAFSCLYEIREFDQLPDDEAQSNLKDRWILFRFDDNIKCPETIDDQELYLIWARQFFGEFDEDKLLQDLEALRESDDLLSPKCNQKWTELIENFISQSAEDSQESSADCFLRYKFIRIFCIITIIYNFIILRPMLYQVNNIFLILKKQSSQKFKFL